MSHKILLIDESAMLRRITANLLHNQAKGYEVFTATRAVEGFARACTGGVGLILLDYQIAGLADAGLCRRLCAEARTSHIPIILFVGQGIQPPDPTILTANVVEILSKPFAPEQITGLVNAIFDFKQKNIPLKEIRSSLHPVIPPGHTRGSFSLPSNEPPASEDKRTIPSSTSLTRPAVVAEGNGDYLAERRVALRGTTRTVSLAATLRAIAARGSSGILSFWSDHAEPTDVVFEGGRLLAVTTRDATTYALSAAENLPGKVSQATLDMALAEQRHSGAPFLLTLGTGGLLSKAAAVSLLRQFGQRHFARLWLQRDLTMKYELQQPDSLPSYVFRLEPVDKSIDEWLLAAARLLRQDDLTPSLRHEGTVGTPFPQADSETLLSSLKLHEEEQEFLALADGNRSLPKIAEMLKVSQEAAYLLAFRFRSLDILSYRPAPTAFVMTPRTRLRPILPADR